MRRAIQTQTQTQPQVNYTLNSNLNNRPFFVVCRLIFSPLVNYLVLPQNLRPILNGIWSVTSTMVGMFGIYPTLRVLFGLRAIIRSNRPLEDLNLYGAEAAKLIIELISPVWSELLTRRFGFSSFTTLVISTTLFYALRPITFIILRWSSTLILSSLGIFWNETLRSIEFLFNYATSVKNFFHTFIGFDFPLPKELVDSAPSYKKVALFIGSMFSLGLLFIGIDIWNPDLLSYIPFMNYILGGFYNLFTPLAATYRFVADIFNFFRNGGL